MKDNTTHRHGEYGLIPPRQSRLFKMGEDWFFAIRRGVDQGPYATESDARAALSQFIREQLAFEQSLRRKTSV